MSQTVDIRELNELIASKSSFVNMITMGMDRVIVGQNGSERYNRCHSGTLPQLCLYSVFAAQ